MDCAQFEEIVHDLDRSGTQGAALREGALVHTESCSRCARLLTEIESLDLGLHSLAARDAGRPAPPRVEQALLREFRREKAASARRRTRWQVAVIGAAAAVLLALGLSVRHRLPSASNGAAAGRTSAPTAPAQTTATSAQPGRDFDQPDDSAYAASFIPLPYADESYMTDGGAVVRVMISQSALASLGLPVAEPDADGAVAADLVVSEDGTPQAIRLVSQASTAESF